MEAYHEDLKKYELKVSELSKDAVFNWIAPLTPPVVPNFEFVVDMSECPRTLVLTPIPEGRYLSKNHEALPFGILKFNDMIKKISEYQVFNVELRGKRPNQKENDERELMKKYEPVFKHQGHVFRAWQEILIDYQLGENSYSFHEMLKDYDWDKGATKTFYTSNPQHTALHDLEYLLDAHVGAETHDNCILGVELNGEYFLRSIENIYKKAFSQNSRIGEYVIDAVNVNTGEYNINTSASSKLYGFTHEEASAFDGLTNFSFLNMAPADSMNELVTTYVHNYNHREKQFTIDCQDNHIMSVRSKMQQLYGDKMKGLNPTSILPLNEEKVSNTILNHSYSSGETKTKRLNDGI